MASYNDILEVLGAVLSGVDAPSDLQDTPTLDAWLATQESDIATELGNQGYTEEQGTLASSYDVDRTVVTFTWDQSAQEQSSVAPLNADAPFLPGRA